MWLEYDKTEIKILLIKNIIIADKINEKIEHYVAATAYGVSKSLQRHKPAESRVKIIDEIDELLTHGLIA